MLILGLNMFHADASAAIVQDGEVAFAVAEERLNRRKHFGGFPALAVKACLDAVGAKISDVNHVAVGQDSDANLAKKVQYALANPSKILNFIRLRQRKESMRDVRSLLAQALEVDSAQLLFQEHHVEHHIAHIASAYYCSPWEKAAGFSYDGSGDFVSTMMARCEGNNIEVLERVFLPHSLGSLYTMICEFIGYSKYGDEGKVMGLAPYGKDSYVDLLSKIVTPKDSGFQLDLSYFKPLGSNSGMQILPDGTVRLARRDEEAAVRQLAEGDLPLGEIIRCRVAPFDAQLQRHNPWQGKVGVETDAGMHRRKIVGGAKHDAVAPNMDRGDGVGRRHLLNSEQAVVSGQQRRRALDHHVEGFDPHDAVRMDKPFRPPHQLGGQMAAQKAVEPGGLLGRQGQEAEARHNGALGQFELAAEGARLGGMQPERGERGGGALRRSLRCEGDRHRALAARQKGFEAVGIVVALDKAQQLEIVAPKHDAVIGGALPEMAAARGQRKAEPGPAHAGAFQIADADDDVVDPCDPVAHAALRRRGLTLGEGCGKSENGGKRSGRQSQDRVLGAAQARRGSS